MVFIDVGAIIQFHTHSLNMKHYGTLHEFRTEQDDGIFLVLKQLLVFF